MGKMSMKIFIGTIYLYFLVCAQESTKETAIGKALYAALPRAKSALPYVPIQAASPLVPEELNLETRWSKTVPIFAPLR